MSESWPIQKSKVWVIAESDSLLGSEGEPILGPTESVHTTNTDIGKGVLVFTEVESARAYVRAGAGYFQQLVESVPIEGIVAFAGFLKGMHEFQNFCAVVRDPIFGQERDVAPIPIADLIRVYTEHLDQFDPNLHRPPGNGNGN